jgi:hypothetical protein
MISNEKAVKTAAVLWILQLAAAILSYSVILDPILYSKNFLTEITAKSTSAKMAMFSDLFYGAAIVGIAIILFPILKKYSERIALWYVGLRVIEFGTIILSGILLLALFSISQEYIQAAASESSYLETLGNLILRQRHWTQNMTITVFCLGASMLYYLLFKS